MAKLKSHGSEIGTIYLTTSAKRYMSDGHVLKNIGFGWKLYAKVKPGISPVDAFNRRKAKDAEFIAARPHFAAYRAMLHDMAGMSKRWKLHAAVEMMPEDCDGVWSEACDGYGYENVSASVDEIAKLCSLYLLAIKEMEQMKSAA